MNTVNSFDSKSTFSVGGNAYTIHRLAALAQAGVGNVAQLPFSIKVLLESLLRTEDGHSVLREDVAALANWDPHQAEAREINFTPARVILQDFTGVPSVVDLAAMREAISDLGGDPDRINPLQPADLIIDHSVQVDVYGTSEAFAINAQREFARNQERYAFLRWGQKAFDNFSIVPPDTGIVHQVNLEYLGRVVFAGMRAGELVAYPDSLVGTDSHTTMINGLGVLGWGVGGIEAEAVMLGQPISLLVPDVVGFRLSGQLPEGATATDLVLTVTQMLRQRGVVGKFVEFCGPGMASLSLPDRATISNMAPEYGATVGMFPVDDETLRYCVLPGVMRTLSNWWRRTARNRACSTALLIPNRHSPLCWSLTCLRLNPVLRDQSVRRIACPCRVCAGASTMPILKSLPRRTATVTGRKAVAGASPRRMRARSLLRTPPQTLMSRWTACPPELAKARWSLRQLRVARTLPTPP